MKSRALVAGLLGASFGVGALVFACEGGSGDTSDGGASDPARMDVASPDVESPDVASPIERCAVHLVLVDDVERGHPDETACRGDTDCVVAHEGDTCGCPYITPRTVTKAISARIEQRNAEAHCTCPVREACDGSGPLPAKAGCVGGRCVVVDAGCAQPFLGAGCRDQ